MLRAVAEYLKEHEHESKDEHRADSWFERLGNVFSVGTLETGYVPPSPTVLYEGEIVGIENRLIREIVDDHVAIIVGRGAAQMLRGRPGVVTVFVHAPEEWRVDRVQQVYKTADRADPENGYQDQQHSSWPSLLSLEATLLTKGPCHSGLAEHPVWPNLQNSIYR